MGPAGTEPERSMLAVSKSDLQFRGYYWGQGLRFGNLCCSNVANLGLHLDPDLPFFWV